MNKEGFKSKKKIINSNIEELKNEMIKLEKEYIESNQLLTSLWSEGLKILG